MPTDTRSATAAVFDDPRHAQQAVDELHRAGFSDEQIGFLGHDRGAKTEEGSKAGEGAAAGAAVGGGAAALWTLGAATGVLPAIGPVIAGGILTAVLASAAGGAVVGGVAGALVGLGIPEEEAGFYAEEFRGGRTIVSVNAGDRYNEAHDILHRYGGQSRS